MPLFDIDRERCARDGICQTVCPTSLVRIRPKDGYPEPLRGKLAACVACGQCVSVCPRDAITLESVPRDTFEPVRRELVPSPEQARQFLRSRRSIRHFREESVPREEIARVLDTARWAPSGTNSQPVRWVVLSSRKSVVEAADLAVSWMAEQTDLGTGLSGELNLPGVVRAWARGRDVLCRDAPHLVFAHAEADGFTHHEDCVIAMTYFELSAWGLGYGTCWAGYVNFAARKSARLRNFLSIPDGHDVFATVMFGRPKFRYRLIPPRNPSQVDWK